MDKVKEIFNNYKDYINKYGEDMFIWNFKGYHEFQHMMWNPGKDYSEPTLEELYDFSLEPHVIDKFKINLVD